MFSDGQDEKIKNSEATSNVIAGGRGGLEIIYDNIEAALHVGKIIQSTYGPHGKDKLFWEKSSNKATITNDGATILKLLKKKIKSEQNEMIKLMQNEKHKQNVKQDKLKWWFSSEPIVELLVNLSQTQDEQIGDGTTSVVLLTCSLLNQAKKLLDLGYHVHIIIQSYKLAFQYIESKLLKNIEFHIDINKNEQYIQHVLPAILSVPFNSKVLKYSSNFFCNLILKAYQYIIRNGSAFDMKSIQILTIPGGSIEDSMVVEGICFKRPFYYAGYESQRKDIKNPKILLLNHEIELKHQKEFARLVINDTNSYDSFMKTEWDLLYRRLEKIYNTGCDVVLDSQTIGDIATQWFAEKNITNLSRIDTNTMESLVLSLGGKIHSSIETLPNFKKIQEELINQDNNIFGTCELFKEITIGDDFYCVFSGLNKNKNFESDSGERVTLVLRGEENLLSEMERSVHDAICILYNITKNPTCLLGGGATELYCRHHLLKYCNSINSSRKDITLIAECMRHYAKALEEIIFILCENASLNATKVIDLLIKQHEKGCDYQFYGIDFGKNKIRNLAPPHNVDPITNRLIIDINGSNCSDNSIDTVLEPNVVKRHVLSTSTEAACFLLSIDYVVVMPSLETEEERSERLAKKYLESQKAQQLWRNHTEKETKEKNKWM
ncbi:hypothetical protein ABK040_011977 [Willaertia magna]